MGDHQHLVDLWHLNKYASHESKTNVNSWVMIILGTRYACWGSAVALGKLAFYADWDLLYFINQPKLN